MKHKSRTNWRTFAWLFGAMISFGMVLPNMQAKAMETTMIETANPCGEDATYTMDNQGNLTISGTGLLHTDKFAYDKTIKTITIEEGITGIGPSTFNECTEVTSVTIPSSVTVIETGAFTNCTKLENITFSEGLTKIGSGAFCNCYSLKMIALPINLKTIETSAFVGCESLTNIEIPETVMELGTNIFYACKNISIYCKENSMAHQYAVNNNLSYFFEEMSDTFTYRIQFDANGGTAAVPSEQKVEENKAIGTLPVSNREGYLFKGWFTEPVTGTQVTESTLITSGMTLYAHWDEIPTPPATIGEMPKKKEASKPKTEIPVQKKEQKISVAKSVTKTYGDSAFYLRAKTNGNGTLTYRVKNKKIANINSVNGWVNINNAGKTTITISAEETKEYKAATKTITLRVKKAKQTCNQKNIVVTYGDFYNMQFNSAIMDGIDGFDFGKNTYKVENKKVAKVSKRGKVSIKGYGRTRVTIQTKGTKNFKAAKKHIAIVVKPKKATLLAMTRLPYKGESHDMRVEWEKDEKASGYVLQYATDANFKDAKTITMKNKNTTSHTFYNLEFGKTYYMRVKAYKQQGKRNVYGPYSSAKERTITNALNIKIKKVDDCPSILMEKGLDVELYQLYDKGARSPVFIADDRNIVYDLMREAFPHKEIRQYTYVEMQYNGKTYYYIVLPLSIEEVYQY